MLAEEHDGEDWDREFADPIGIGKLLSAVDRHLAWCRQSEDETMRLDDDEFGASMRLLEDAEKTIGGLLNTLVAIGDCLLSDDNEAACLHVVTETNIFAGLAGTADMRHMSDKEIERADRHVHCLNYFLDPRTSRDYSRAARCYGVLRRLVVKELRRELRSTYAGAVEWVETDL